MNKLPSFMHDKRECDSVGRMKLSELENLSPAPTA